MIKKSWLAQKRGENLCKYTIKKMCNGSAKQFICCPNALIFYIIIKMITELLNATYQIYSYHSLIKKIYNWKSIFQVQASFCLLVNKFG